MPIVPKNATESYEISINVGGDGSRRFIEKFPVQLVMVDGKVNQVSFGYQKIGGHVQRLTFDREYMDKFDEAWAAVRKIVAQREE